MLNISIILGAFVFATNQINSRVKNVSAYAAITIGVLAHVYIGYYNYKTGNCVTTDIDASIVYIANACIPPKSNFIIHSQILIIGGLFILLSQAFKRIDDKYSKK